jgi:hypothetical protein
MIFLYRATGSEAFIVAGDENSPPAHLDGPSSRLDKR